MADVEEMPVAVSSNGKEFEVYLWIGITIHEVISSKDILGLRRKVLTNIDITLIKMDSK